MKNNNITMKLTDIGTNKQTVFIYGLSKFEDKQELTDLFTYYLSLGAKVGSILEAWKLYDTSYSFKFTKKINESVLQFNVA